jgi:hypothetical protein
MMCADRDKTILCMAGAFAAALVIVVMAYAWV